MQRLGGKIVIVTGAMELIPLGWLAQSEEVSRVGLFFASDESSFVSGVENVVHGVMIAG
jgi:NAD(P)-dependent dehydrogenase (short-subunit alcohol dehydrogenase family)